MSTPMKKQYLVRITLSGLALFVLINVMVERAAADELSSAATAAMVDDTAGATTVQALQQHIVVRSPKTIRARKRRTTAGGSL